MDEIVRLVDILSASSGADDKLFAVATVVNTKGSVYRRPGARMLIANSMKVSGAVSAGCLERDIIAQCESLIDNPRPLLLTYDGESADEMIFGLRLGCDGIVQILVEPAVLVEPILARLQSAVGEIFSKGRKLVAVTIFSVESELIEAADDLDALLGTVMLATETETIELKPLSTNLSKSLVEHTKSALSEIQSKVVEIEVDGLKFKAFVEVSLPRQSLLVFGAGQDTEPVLKIATVLGWQVAHVSDRNFVQAYASLQEQLFDGCLIMTHDYEADKQILQSLFNPSAIGSLPAYIGIVGPKRRSQKLFAELALSGIVISPELQERVFSPVGLDIGAERPEEIALSILAEMQAVRTSHSGGFLKDKEGPIHSTRLSLSVKDENNSLLHFPESHPINSSCNILDA